MHASLKMRLVEGSGRGDSERTGQYSERYNEYWAEQGKDAASVDASHESRIATYRLRGCRPTGPV